MHVARTVFLRCLTAPSLAPVLFLGGVAAWVSSTLAASALGADAAFLAEVRQGSLLFAGLLFLSLAEPLETGREARDGLLLLRAVRGGGFALTARWAGLLAATLVSLLPAAVVGGGWPRAPLAVVAGLGVFVAGGLLLGACLRRAHLVPALWALAVATHLRPWLASEAWTAPVAWLLPDLAAVERPAGLGAAACWVAGALLLTHARLARVAAGGPWPAGAGAAGGAGPLSARPAHEDEAPGRQQLEG